MSEFKGKDFGTVLTERNIEDAIDNGEAKSLIRHLENVIVQKALIKTHGNITKAAELVRMNRGTVRKILERAEG
ncbi:helix-turn-helix domain-containing protein [uncultured Acinetobacter sp.]|uniref:helix-turn-helix domain-containing protein n=1 Tax=uncultured Acinetobacter sp. TaxID=165433 RepID=UPI0025D42355|nr:helix-turn-helix domain-containing protein [uncultured Acinetobacter sp.]